MRAFLISIPFFLCASMITHIQTVIRCDFHEIDDHIEVNVSIEKGYASLLYMLNKKNDVSKSKTLYMQSIIKNDLKIELNDKKVVLELEEVFSNERGIQIKYKAPKTTAKINEVKLSIQELLKNTDDHAAIDIWLHLNNKKRLFKINKNKLSLKATY